MPVFIQEDTVDNFDWDRIETTTDDNGVLQSRFIGYDDGTTLTFSYEAGVLRHMIRSDLDPFGGTSALRPWETIETFFDANGDLSAYVELRDDGVTTLKQYDAGTLRYVEQVDLGPGGAPSDARGWERIETYYDPNGQLDARFELWDDGVTLLKQYDAGTLRLIEQVDLGPDGSPSDARIWERIELHYDAGGQLQTRVELRDDGVTMLTQFEAGRQRYTEHVDLGPDGSPSDARSWERIELHYDASGQLQTRFELRDTGVTMLSEFDAGTLRRLEQVDLGPDGSPSDVHNWERIEFIFDENRQLQSRFEQRDDGATTLQSFEGGVLRTILREDRDPMGGPSDAYVWDSISIMFDAEGTIEARETIYDNGDVIAFFFEGGQRDLRLEYDGDGSHSWLVRETFFDETGRVATINTYDTAEEVPPEYGILTWA